MNSLAFVAESVASQKAQIRSFARLPNGWHYGEGRGATEKAIATALDVNSLLLEYNAHDIEAFPGVDGGILLSGYRDDDTLEVRCDPSGRMDMLHEVNDEIINEQCGVSLEEIGAYLEGLEWTPKNSFVYCIQGISVDKKDGSQVRLFSHPPTEASLFSIPNALLTIAVANAPTLVGTIKASPDTLLFSGESIRVISKNAARLHVNLRPPAIPATGISAAWQTAFAEGW